MIEKTSADLKKEERLRIRGKKKSSAVDGTKRTFTGALDDALQFDFQGTIDELMEDLREQERRFIDTQSLVECNRYKALVQKILKALMDESFSTVTLKRMRRDRADYIIVQKINTRLDEITSAISKNNRAFDLLKTIEEIRGLLLDLKF